MELKVWMSLCLIFGSFAMRIGHVYASGMWWTLGTAYTFAEDQIFDYPCRRIPGFQNRQLRYCEQNEEFVPTVAEGAKQGIDECQFQFRGRRWNCTTIEGDESVFGKILQFGSREKAFVNSIFSAGVAHSISRACSRGDYIGCSCDTRHQGPADNPHHIIPNATWRWGGCSEDVEFGLEFSRKFISPKEHWTRARVIMDRHNDEAGRKAVADSLELKCKCHGISGSCELKSCWWQMVPFRRLGAKLKDKYDSAAEMRVVRQSDPRGRVEVLEPKSLLYKPPTKADLIYYDPSPDYCRLDPELGSLGTVGRTCNRTSDAIDGCQLMCCGRGYNTIRRQVVERCNCQFVWCCKVVCDECVRNYEVHTCK
ncbi:proto-oncogene Wnt-3-like [Patiria miniata]|uniref:Protein Wnt n=1 Tax=Patiria miniata TaxID=46514 RepID=A0A914BAJ4_PATMI|nr:proto-oncogene Wnt-3-like [Patiria miniata]